MNRSNDEPSVLDVFFDQAANESLSVSIQVGGGLIKEPQGGAEQNNARKRNAPFLARR